MGKREGCSTCREIVEEKRFFASNIQRRALV